MKFLGMEIITDPNLRRDTGLDIMIVAQRKIITPRVVLPDGSVVVETYESEEDWGKRCGGISGIKSNLD
jgi:hypothetical protein